MASNGGDGKWHTVKAKDKSKKTKEPSAKSGMENGGVTVTMPVFAALDREQGPKAKAAQRHAASSSPESRSGETLGQSESSQDGPHSVSPDAGKKAKAKKPKVKKLSPKDAGPSLPSAAAFKDTLRGVREQYKYQEQAQLGRVADIFGNAYKEVELPFNKLITEGPLDKVTDIPLRDCPPDLAAAAVAFIGEMETRPVAKFLLSLLEEYFDGVPETNGKTPVPKAKVGLLLVMSLVLRAVPASLFVITDEILQKGDKWTGAMRLPYMLWVFNQAARGQQGMAIAMWVRILLPQLLGGHLPSTKTKSVWHYSGPVDKMGPASAQKALLYLDGQLSGMLPPSNGAKQVVAPATGKKDVTVSMTVDCSSSSLPSLLESAVRGISYLDGTQLITEPVVTPNALEAVLRVCYTKTPAVLPDVEAKLTHLYPALRDLAFKGAANGGFSAEEELKLGLETASAANGGQAPYDGEQDALVDLVSRNIVACLQASPSLASTWQSRHKAQLKGSARVLQHLAHRNPIYMDVLVSTPAARKSFCELLEGLQERQASLLEGTGKSWQTTCARIADAACKELRNKLEPARKGGRMVWAAAFLVAATAGAAAALKLDAVQDILKQVQHHPMTGQVETMALELLGQAEAFMKPYWDQAVAVLK